MKVDRKKARYEVKFVIDDFAKFEIENMIRVHPSLFNEIYSERNVNNLYLDSVSLSSYFDNLAGIAQRLKIRVRWYGSLFGFIEKPVLEIKFGRKDFKNAHSVSNVFPFRVTKSSKYVSGLEML